MGASWRRLAQRMGGATLICCGLIAGLGLFAETGDSKAARSQPSGSHTTVSPTRPPLGHEHELLPDLDQELPAELDVRADTVDGAATSYRLGFRSAVRNVGDGPLVVEGTRPDTSSPTMTVHQVVERVARAARVVPDVGHMQYSVSPSHSHWHYLQFDRYELQRYVLRRAGSDEVLVTDRKTGFCLGDRYRVPGRRLAAAPLVPIFTGGCGLGRPDLIHIREGISVGYGDDYSAFLEGQDLSLEGVGDGRYVLVHRVNADHHLQELSYANNAASLLLDIQWRKGVPHVRIVASCPDTDQCDE